MKELILKEFDNEYLYLMPLNNIGENNLKKALGLLKKFSNSNLLLIEKISIEAFKEYSELNIQINKSLKDKDLFIKLNKKTLDNLLTLFSDTFLNEKINKATKHTLQNKKELSIINNLFIHYFK